MAARSGRALRTEAAAGCESGHGITQRGAGRDDHRQHRVQPVGRDGALDAQPLGARPYPPDPVAHRVRGYAMYHGCNNQNFSARVVEPPPRVFKSTYITSLSPLPFLKYANDLLGCAVSGVGVPVGQHGRAA